MTLAQVKQYLEMESNDEKLHQRIEKSKINEAKEMAKKKAIELDKQRVEKKTQSPGVNETLSALESRGMGGGSGSDMGMDSNIGGMGGSNMGGNNMGMGMGISGGMQSSGGGYDATAVHANVPKKGMQLGRKKPQVLPTTTEMNSMHQNEVPSAGGGVLQDPNQPTSPVASEKRNPLQEPVAVCVEETLEASLGAEGGLSGDVTIQGKFEIRVYDETKADLACFQMAPLDQKFKYRLHPNLNKQSQATNLLEIRDPSRRYRPNSAAPLLKWQQKSSDEDMIPVSVTCWPSPEADGVQMIIQYELTMDSAVLENVTVSIPGCQNASVKVIEGGECDHRGETLTWIIPRIDSDNASGTLEFFARADQNALLPVDVRAVSSTTLCAMEIQSCYHQSSKDNIKYALSKQVEYKLTVG